MVPCHCNRYCFITGFVTEFHSGGHTLSVGDLCGVSNINIHSQHETIVNAAVAVSSVSRFMLWATHREVFGALNMGNSVEICCGSFSCVPRKVCAVVVPTRTSQHKIRAFWDIEARVPLVILAM